MNNKRIPRPRGYTEIASIHNKEQTDNSIKQCIDHIIHHYIDTGFTYCGTSLSIEEFASLTGIPASEIHQAIILHGKDTLFRADPKDAGEALRALVGIAINGALGDKALAAKQYSIMAQAQGNSYRPFISSEVTKALKLGQDATMNILNITKSLAGNGGLQILIQNGAQANTADRKDLMTTESALELLEQASQKAPLLENKEDREALFQEHNVASMPEVNARKQQGLDTTRESLNFQDIANVSEGLVEDDIADNRTKHTNRRAAELGVDEIDDELL